MSRVPVKLSDKEYDRINDLIYKHYPNACILFVDRVIHPEREEAHQKLKESMGDSVKTYELFHGTREEVVPYILRDGFDPSRNVRSAYGLGSYFAKSANYSKDYMDISSRGISFMFICDVIGARLCKGVTDTAIDKEKYDLAVDSLSRPTIFVTPHKYGGIPRYVVGFHKNAPK